jgi:hypothetical protein
MFVSFNRLFPILGFDMKSFLQTLLKKQQQFTLPATARNSLSQESGTSQKAL